MIALLCTQNSFYEDTLRWKTEPSFSCLLYKALRFMETRKVNYSVLHLY